MLSKSLKHLAPSLSQIAHYGSSTVWNLPVPVAVACYNAFVDYRAQAGDKSVYRKPINGRYADLPIKKNFQNLAYRFFKDEMRTHSGLRESYLEAQAKGNPFTIIGIRNSEFPVYTPADKAYDIGMATAMAQFLGLRPWTKHVAPYNNFFEIEASISEPLSLKELEFHTDFPTYGNYAPTVNWLLCMHNNSKVPTYYVKAETIWAELNEEERKILTECEFIFEDRHLRQAKEHVFHIFSYDPQGKLQICFDADLTDLCCKQSKQFTFKQVQDALQKVCDTITSCVTKGQAFHSTYTDHSIFSCSNKYGVHGRFKIPHTEKRSLIRMSFEDIPPPTQQEGVQAKVLDAQGRLVY